MFLTILVFLLILSVLVLIHEAGHFFVAKKLGIKVEEFGFGLPPRAFGKKIGETMYSLNWLPIGGFVKLYGEDEAGKGSIRMSQVAHRNDERKAKSEDLIRAFFARPPWQKAIVVGAGVLMNFILAVAIISYLFGFAGVGVPGNKVIVTQIVKNSPADTAGIKVNEVIESINGIKVTSPTQLVSLTKEHLGEKIKVDIRNEKSGARTLEIIPRKTYPKTEGPMGIAIAQNIEIKKYPWYQAPILGTKEALKDSWLIVSGLAMIVYQLVTLGTVPQGVAGPVGIAQLTGQFVQVGPLAVLSFVALLSLNLAILNVLPIPALDGGRLFFILIEATTGRKVNQKFETWAHTVGMAILLALIALITLHDLIRLLQGQPILPNQ